jgi:glutathione S-transferase
MTMITLYTFGPGFGLPDPSPFVMKAEVLLRIAGLPYRVDSKGFSKAPKGKLPYIDDGERIADFTVIRWHLEKKHKVDFDRGLSEEQPAVAWAFEKTAEDHLYWALYARWMNDANFDKVPRNFFQVSRRRRSAPLIVNMMRRKVRQSLRAPGMGRHAPAEVAALATRSIDAMAAYLGRKAFFVGAEPVGVDATVFSFVAGALCPTFETPIRSAAERHDNLKRYVGRMTARFYPDLREIAGCQTAA